MDEYIKIPEEEVRKVGYTLAGYYAGAIENNYPAEITNFEPFGADAIKHCYEYIAIVDAIEIPYLPNGLVDTEAYRCCIEEAIADKYLK